MSALSRWWLLVLLPWVALAQPASPENDLHVAVTGQRAFAAALGPALSREGNLAFSPWSLNTALALVRAGARGGTASAFDAALHNALPAERYQAALAAFDRKVLALGEQGGVVATAANRLYVARDFALVPAYRALLTRTWKGGVEPADFAAAPARARSEINAWVAQGTGGLIPELLGPSAVTEKTRSVLVNAVSFKARWPKPFDPKRTRALPFKSPKGPRKVPTLTADALEAKLLDSPEVTALELPYQGEGASLWVLMPKAQSLEDFDASLSASKLESLQQRAEWRQVKLSLPKFKVRSRLALGPALAKLGVPFSGDFTGMTAEPFVLGEVLQECVLEVDETGTVAAAASAVMGITGMPEAPVPAVIDRPFLFFVIEKSGGVLFRGRVVDPSAP